MNTKAITTSVITWIVSALSGEHRSHLKFNWPIQLTLAHPDYPNYQLTLFLVHQSGGHIFDEGGVNSVGIGYRFEP